MKGTDGVIPDACEPVCPEDVRPSVKDLIQDHRTAIDELTRLVADHPLYEPQKHDDLFVLRYVLSHKKKMKAAVKALKHTLEFRAKHKLDEKDIRDTLPHTYPSGPLREYWDLRCPGESLICTLPDRQRGSVLFLDPGMMVPGTSNQMTKEVWSEAFYKSQEWGFQWLDYVTRTTGRLTKQTRLMNLEHVGFKSTHRKDIKWDGAIMNEMEDVYPQMLGAIYCCNAPTIINVLWGIAKKIMPKRVVEKFNIVDPEKNPHDRDAILQYISVSALPTMFGGENTIPPSQWKF